jgi:hypothetical protein
MAVTKENAIFWDVTPHGSYTNFSEERVISITRVTRIDELGTEACAAYITLMMEAILSSETSVLNKSHMVSHPRRLHSSEPGWFLLAIAARKFVYTLAFKPI